MKKKNVYLLVIACFLCSSLLTLVGCNKNRADKLIFMTIGEGSTARLSNGMERF